MPHVVLLDNYDSFTWNLYEYLCREGAQVTVYRNDKITIEEIEALKPDLIMISPGPGHPSTDSGISCDVVQFFAGKIPIFGVCMGLQCIVHIFGGTVEYAGEIVHGKTSPLEHTNKGVFAGVQQGSLATRYHSLAARKLDLPADFEVTATSPGGIIQGVRHKTLSIEGVQFHPESIMSDGGRLMIRNFLAYSGGKWDTMPAIVRRPAADSDAKAPLSILDNIYSERRRQISIEQQLPGRSYADLEKSLALGIAPPLIDFAARLRASPHKMSLLAEIKRASPSKGDIALGVHAASQALEYAKAGAAAISVLTEPKWFKGSIEDLRQARLAVDQVENRPAILRKEFVFDKYQILEARLMGADTVLLIVKMLNDFLLRELYEYSKSIGMEPLVEVSNASEMERAVALGSKVIGVNNRDLHSFVVDMNTTSAIAASAPKDTILAALSGISGREQVDLYAQQGVGAVLVGEALMRAPNPADFVLELVG